jgi:hypothetical protein
MGILNTVKQATFQGPTRFALHSVEGFGKTTLAAFFPAPLFVCGESGFPRDLGRAPSFVAPKTWQDVLALVDELIASAHAFESVVFDTMDWIEPLIWRYVCERDTSRKSEMNPKGNTLESIEDYGYGKGYLAAMEEMRRLLTKLDDLQTKRAMHVVILMHSWVKPFHNPAGDNFDRWVPKMHERCARLVVEWAENVFFGYFEITTLKDDPKDKKAKGSSTGRRILGTRHNAMFDAKNRFNLPDTIELNAPTELMPYLLGKHIKPPLDAKAASPAGKLPIAPVEAPKDDDKEPARNADYQSAKSTAPKESVAETQKKIRDEYEKNTGQKVEAPKESPNDADAQEMAQIGAMLDDVSTHCGPKLRKDIEKWIASADTPEKLNWCFAEANKHITAAKKKAGEQPAA